MVTSHSGTACGLTRSLTRDSLGTVTEAADTDCGSGRTE